MKLYAHKVTKNKGQIMNSCNARKFFLSFLLCTLSSFTMFCQDTDFLDVMVDFTYPVSVMQSMRQDISQALFAAQDHQVSQAASFLEQAASQLDGIDMITQDDRQFIQAMLDKINSLIDQLPEEQDRSVLMQLSCTIQNKL